MTNSIGLHKFLCQQANQVVILLNITLVQNINSAAIDLNSDLMKIVIGFFNGKWNFILILKAKRRPILSGFFRVACRIPIQILLSYYLFLASGAIFGSDSTSQLSYTSYLSRWGPGGYFKPPGRSQALWST